MDDLLHASTNHPIIVVVVAIIVVLVLMKSFNQLK